MKTKLIFIILISIGIRSYGQSIRLEDIIGRVYFDKKPDRVDTLYITYVIPNSIGFIDTTKAVNKYPVKIKYLRDDKEFENELNKGNEVKKLSICIDELLEDSIVMTIDLKETNSKLYFGNKNAHFFTSFDKRQIMIVYDKKRKVWIYSSLIKQFSTY